MRALGTTLLWACVSMLGAGAFAALALHRGETISAAWMLVAALCTYAVGYRFHGRAIARRVFALDRRRATPAVRLDDGHDYVPTNSWVVFGHHFSAIAGAGPLVGPILAAQFGYLPGTIWIIVGVVLGGAVQDFVVLCASMRRDGKSLAQMAREEIGRPTGMLALIAILGIILILIAFLAYVVVAVLAKSPWGTVTISLTIPIALLMGVWMRWIRPGRVLEASAIGIALLIVALIAGKWVAAQPALAATLTFSMTTVSWSLIVYGFLASVLPVWLLLAPRDYLSAFVKVGTVGLLAIGVFLVMPSLRMPAINPLCVGDGAWASGNGAVSTGTIFPFCFITIACGSISGFHALVASGTTPKLIANEEHAPAIGYGGMLVESFVAVLAMIAACSLHPGIYFAMNAGQFSKGPQDVVAVAGTVNQWISSWGFTLTPDQLQETARTVGEPTIVGRTGGAATLAVGMTQIFSGMFGGRGADLWYHFAIMFEALFILTTIDAGTRVGRFLFQEAAGHLWKPLGRITWMPGVVLCSALISAGWGYFLLAGVADPNGGVKALLPLFGIANQLLAAIALAVATVIIVRMGKARWAWVTVLPLAWLVVVTETAGWQKLFSTQPAVGLLTGMPSFNQWLNAWLIGSFMVIIALMVLISAWECWLLLTGRRPLRADQPPEPQPSEAELREA
jgi:carbon starvation protein